MTEASLFDMEEPEPGTLSTLVVTAMFGFRGTLAGSIMDPEKVPSEPTSTMTSTS